MKKLVLFVPGFVVDVYSEIEASFVDLSAAEGSDVEFLWVVPHITNKHNSFSRESNRGVLREPLYVEQLRHRGIRFIVEDIAKFNAFKNFLLFRKIFRQWPVEVVYTHFGYERFWAALCGKLWGRRTVWNEHWFSLGTRFTRFKRVFYRLCVDEFISVSQFITSTLPKRATVHTIPNAIRPADKPSAVDRRQIRRDIGVSPDAPVVLMVAAFRSEKRHGLAVNVCEEVAKVAANVHFIFLGDGSLRQSFINDIARRGIKNVIAPGHVDNVEDYYQVADVCMLTSYYEPFGYAVLESMKVGVPVVCFDNGGPAEIIANQKSGVLIKEGDVKGFAYALVELLRNGETRARMGLEARRVVETTYNRSVWTSKICAVLAGPIPRTFLSKQGNGRRSSEQNA